MPLASSIMMEPSGRYQKGDAMLQDAEGNYVRRGVGAGSAQVGLPLEREPSQAARAECQSLRAAAPACCRSPSPGKGTRATPGWVTRG